MDISIRRYYLDKLLEDNVKQGNGLILDLGGKKDNKRGEYRPKSSKKLTWLYLNNDVSTKPDILCDLPEISVKSESVDCVLLIETLEYIPNLEVLFGELYRILKKDGELLVSFPFLHSIHGDKKYDYYRLTENCFRYYIRDKFSLAHENRMGGMIAVIYDLLRCYFSYQVEDTVLNKSIRKVLKFSRILFLYLDKILFRNNFYINTGYFFVCKKV